MIYIYIYPNHFCAIIGTKNLLVYIIYSKKRGDTCDSFSLSPSQYSEPLPAPPQKKQCTYIYIVGRGFFFLAQKKWPPLVVFDYSISMIHERRLAHTTPKPPFILLGRFSSKNGWGLFLLILVFLCSGNHPPPPPKKPCFWFCSCSVRGGTNLLCNTGQQLNRRR